MKVGDRVVSKYKGANLTRGKVYRITSVHDDGNSIIIGIKTDNGRVCGYFSGVFYTMQELRKMKLDKLNIL